MAKRISGGEGPRPDFSLVAVRSKSVEESDILGSSRSDPE